MHADRRDAVVLNPNTVGSFVGVIRKLRDLERLDLDPACAARTCFENSGNCLARSASIKPLSLRCDFAMRTYW